MIKYLIILQINPQVAVDNVANTGLIGSFFIIFLALIVAIAIILKKTLLKFIEKMNEERIAKDKEADKNRENMLHYVMQKNDIFTEVIKNYSESNDSLKIVLEKILAKL